MNKKKLMTLLISLSLITTYGCAKKEDGYILEMYGNSLVVYEGTEIYSSVLENDRIIFTLKNGEEYSLFDGNCIVTESRDEADNYYEMFNKHQSTISNARDAEEKEKIYYVMEIINNNLIIYEATNITFYGGADCDEIHIVLKNGEEHTFDDKKCIVTENKEVAKNYYDMFDKWENTNAVWIKVDKKEKTR